MEIKWAFIEKIFLDIFKFLIKNPKCQKLFFLKLIEHYDFNNYQSSKLKNFF